MNKYVVIYTGVPPRDSDATEIRKSWAQWFNGLGSAVIDVGNPFSACMTVAADGSTNDEESLRLTGYSIVAAESLAAAAHLVKTCPALANASVQVYETVPFG